MCKIKNISIKNFRGIGNLSLSNLSNVNVILGNNNSGKSTLLEAVMLLLGAQKPVLPFEMNSNRNVSRISQAEFPLFFNGLDVNTPISIESDFENGYSRHLDIRYNEEDIQEASAEQVQRDGASRIYKKYELLYDYIDGENRNRSYISLNTSSNTVSVDFTEKEPLYPSAIYIAPRYNFNDYISHFNQIVTQKETENIVNILKTVEPRIQDIRVVDDVVLVDVGLDKLIPINLLGDGTRKLFTIAVALYNSKDSILNIDEIDNGLYFKTMRVMWKTILKASADLNIQLFITTHSLDSLQALSDLLTDEDMNYREKVNIFTLRKYEDDEVVSYPYNYDKYSYLLSREEEIR